MTDEVETRTYEIHTDHGAYRVEVPAAWKITFGAIVPGKNGGSSSGSYGIRIWEADNKQRLVMDGVKWFRDVSLPMQVQAVRKYGEEEWYEEPALYGAARDKFLETVEKKWIEIDLVRTGPPPGSGKDEPDAVDDGWNSVRSMKAR